MKKVAWLSLPLLLASCGLFGTPEQTRALHTEAGLTAFDGQKLDTRPGKSARFSLDAEPEYITVSPDSRVAYVSLQESNALAVLDIASGAFTAVHPLGLKDWSRSTLDASDKDGKINPQAWPVLGAYMPDAIASYRVNGQTYILSANEGDGREYKGFADEVRVKDLRLDPQKFPNAAALQDNAALGRLTVSRVDADTDGDGDADRLVAFGGRSLSVWNTQGTLVGDTADLFERTVAAQRPAAFNSEGTAETFDTRSDNKGPEPEALAVAALGGKHFAFVGLERAGGIMVLDVSNPAQPGLVQYFSDIDAAAAAESGAAGDLAPEGLLFIPAADSPNGQPLLVSSNEVSGSVSVYALANDGRLGRLGRYQAAPFQYGKGVAEISAYDPASRRLFTVNGATGGLDILDLSDVAAPRLADSVDLTPYGGGANSVAVSGGVVAVAVQAKT
ncbi:MAG: choice-of-anchor I family protein, partial [Deinococcus sp.]|nr:choice-of-anchor I family protein [Deinococcus sp.]